MIQILFEAKSDPPKTQIVLTVDDVFLRNEWTDGIETVSSNKIRPEEDSQVLDMLELMDTNATLFVCGIVAKLFPERLKELAGRNFEIAAHGYRHENFQLLNPDEQRRRVEWSLELLEECVGRRVTGWRSPGLHADADFYRMLKNTHLLYCSNVELPLFFKHVPFIYRGKVELPIAIIDLKLHQSGLSLAKIRQKMLATLNQHHETLTLVIHPWFQLQDSERLRVLKDFLEVGQSMDGVTFSRGFDVCQQFLLRGSSLYAAGLSAISIAWKQVSGFVHSPLSKMYRMIL